MESSRKCNYSIGQFIFIHSFILLEKHYLELSKSSVHKMEMIAALC